jgi:peptidoglycan hydrolase-like protein with peptidoglycan-binding domain
MTPQKARLALGTFMLLSVGVTLNVLVMQPPGMRPAGARAGKPEFRRDVVPPRPAQPIAATNPGVSPPSGDNIDTVTAIQRELAARDYELAAPDGIASPATRAAIMAWEHDNGLALTGEPTSAVLKAIILGVDATTVSQIAIELKALPREREPRTQHLIRSVQQALADLGYNLGAPSGHMNDDTARAIREFEQEQTLPPTGRISSTLVSRLAAVGRASGTAAQR